MAAIFMRTRELLDCIGNSQNSASAKGCIEELRSIFTEIEKTANGLNGVWDDDAQRIFMDRFKESSAAVNEYLMELDSLLTEVSVFSGRVTEWDAKLTARLSDRYLNI